MKSPQFIQNFYKKIYAKINGDDTDDSDEDDEQDVSYDDDNDFMYNSDSDCDYDDYMGGHIPDFLWEDEEGDLKGWQMVAMHQALGLI